MTTTNSARYPATANRAAEMLEYLGAMDSNFGAYGSRFIAPTKNSYWDSFLELFRSIINSSMDAAAPVHGLLRQLMTTVVEKINGPISKSLDWFTEIFREPTRTRNIIAIASLGASLGIGGAYLASVLHSRVKRRLLFRREAAEYSLRRQEVVEGREARIAAGSPLLYVERVSQQIVGKLGGIPSSAAERAAAERLAYRIMREDNHRYSHIARDMPFVMALVLTPNLGEQQRAAYKRALQFKVNPHDYSFLSLVVGDHGDEVIDNEIPEEQ